MGVVLSFLMAPLNDQTLPSRRGLRPYTKVVVAAVLVLIFLGGQVTSHDAGLAVPDWPTSYGVNMFLFHWSNWVGGIFHEHVHRLVASLVGFLTLVLAVWLTLAEPRRWVKVLGYAALAAVVLQGVLGGLTVIYQLPTPISTSHAVLAQTFLVLAVIIAYAQSRERASRLQHDPAAESHPLMAASLVLMGLVYVQLILGALMRHTGSGLAIPDFPTMGGQWLPWFTDDTLARINDWRLEHGIESGQELPPVAMVQVWIHFSHRIGAFAIALAAIALTTTAWRIRNARPDLWETMYLLDMMIIVQLCLGIFTVLTQKVPIVASIHVVLGAAVLASSALLVLRACPVRLRQRLHGPGRAALRAVST